MSTQKCPVCGGKGIVLADFYSILPPGVTPISTTAINTVNCRACYGRGVIQDISPIDPMERITLTKDKLSGPSDAHG